MKELEPYILDFLYSDYGMPGVLNCDSYVIMDWVLQPNPKEVIQAYLNKCSYKEYHDFLQKIIESKPVNSKKLIPILGDCTNIPNTGVFTLNTVYKPEVQSITFEIESYYQITKMTLIKKQ